METIKINEKYKPLYTSDTDIIIITGGRGSAKSFTVSDWACRLTYQKNAKILYTRYTLTSAKDSIIPEYKDKIDLFNAEKDFKVTEHNIINKNTGSQIIFKGIKNSSGNQTANLKSIKDPTKWICDEASEIPDYDTFQKIRRSLRKKGAKIQTVLLLNPETPEHWIYKHFFEDKQIPNFFNGIKDGITYIHTDYRDNKNNLDEAFLKDAEDTKNNDEMEYRNVFLGEWLDYIEDKTFAPSKLNRFKISDLEKLDKKHFRGVFNHTDVAYGGDDFFCSVFGAVYGDNVYIIDVICNNFDPDENEELLVGKLKQNKVKDYAIETNAGGEVFGSNIYKKHKNNYISIKSHENKIVRILTEAKDIKKHFYFLIDEDMDKIEDYKVYFNKLTAFSTKIKSKKNKKDPADATAGLCSFLRYDFYMFE